MYFFFLHVLLFKKLLLFLIIKVISVSIIDLIGTFVKLKFEKNQKTVFIYLP